ncbi:hypothetical protein SOV_22270 [Sporomusa ovata DSM 2662]|uniref:DUF2207 domain-containing protein n=2 Tax=Sporomusa ovata TaxID=2378 RepID=A0A0U1L364_9FIRM|nr:DUF2207 domain-containing protein [Sporomusa ovata]EQB25544.1 hypothetical protein SOV_4c02060 [Sporomusa ovata DSM 2662]CQR74108.1 hypothetical protein SpAn4DRAFT_0570 [Sporomusa ovata]
MNKKGVFLRHKIGWLCLILWLLLFLPDTALARSLSMEQVVVEAEVLPDASLRVTERIAIDFSGKWNGFHIKIPQSGTPVREVKVAENGRPYTFNPGTQYGPPGTFLIKDEGYQITIDWSIAAQDEVRTFDVSYRIINAVVIHNDVAELYRKFIGSANPQRIREVKVKLKLPAGAERLTQGKDIKIWGHGPLQGEVAFSGFDSITWQAAKLPPYTFVEGRVVMPTALFPGAPSAAYTNRAALAGILAEEEAWAQAANRERWLARAEIAGAVLLIVCACGVVLLLWRKYGRPYPAKFDGTYYRELPAPYSPAELSVLWNYSKVQGHDLTATILDLARRKFLRIEEEHVNESKLLGNRKVKTYRLIFLDAPQPAALRNPAEAELRAHEQDLLDYLRHTIACGREYLFLADIEVFAKSHSRDFYGFWRSWVAGINEQMEQADFFDHSGNMPLATVLGGLLLFTLGAIVLFNSTMTILGVSLLIAAAIIALIPRSFKRRSPSGQEDFVRWQAFKRFLLHFSQMQRHEIPSLIIWEHYLVYAVTLGVAREVMKQLELVFPNLQDGDYRFGYGWYSYGAHIGFDTLHGSFSDIENVVERSIKTAEKAISKSSSDSGGGGGFSSGGGGGGGGSSYGGR